MEKPRSHIPDPAINRFPAAPGTSSGKAIRTWNSAAENKLIASVNGKLGGSWIMSGTRPPSPVPGVGPRASVGEEGAGGLCHAATLSRCREGGGRMEKVGSMGGKEPGMGQGGRGQGRPGSPGGRSDLQQRESGGKEAEGRQRLPGSGTPT